VNAAEFAQRRPGQKLCDAIDLVVVSAMRKGKQLEQEAVEPIGVSRQVNMPRLDFGRLGHHRSALLPFGFWPIGWGMQGGGVWCRSCM
jgi:hypothetical protein